MSGSGKVTGDLVAGDVVNIFNQARIDGSVYYGSVYKRSAPASIGGTALKVTPPPQPCECGYDLTQRLAIVASHNDNAILTTLPNANLWYASGAIHISGQAVTLPAGRYYVSDVSLGGQGRLVPAAGAQVELFVERGISVGTGSFLGGDPTAASRLLVISGADSALGESVSVANNTDASLTLYAPKANITLSNNSRLYGAVVARGVTMDNSQELFLSPGPQTSPPRLTCE
jgi:hypothetical protein